jgi:hypothetical protein
LHQGAPLGNSRRTNRAVKGCMNTIDDPHGCWAECWNPFRIELPGKCPDFRARGPHRAVTLRRCPTRAGFGNLLRRGQDALGWLCGGLVVALGWLCTPESMPSICLPNGFKLALKCLWAVLGGFRPRSLPGKMPCARARIRPEASLSILNPPSAILVGRGAAASCRCRENPDSSCTSWRTAVNHTPGICWSRTKCREVERPKTEQDSPGLVVSGARSGAYLHPDGRRSQSDRQSCSKSKYSIHGTNNSAAPATCSSLIS